MNKSGAGYSAMREWVGPLVVTFVLVKLLLLFVSGDFLRHLAVAIVLLCVPLAVSGRLALQFFVPGFVRRPHRMWGTYFCFLYAVLPFSLLFVFMPSELSQARVDLRQWVLSVSGLSAIIIAPLAEEFYFRGWLLNAQLYALSNNSGDIPLRLPWSSFVWICYLNGLVFWLLHIPIETGWLEIWTQALKNGLLPVSPGPFLLGFTTCALTLLTGTPRSAVVFHMLANALGPLWLPLLQEQRLRALFYY